MNASFLENNNLSEQMISGLVQMKMQLCVQSIGSPRFLACTARGSVSINCDMRCFEVVPLMMLLVMHQPHLHQPWQLDGCDLFIPLHTPCTLRFCTMCIGMCCLL